MATTWVVVADSSRARILATDSAQDPLEEIASLDHPESRLHETDLVSDAPGRRKATSGPKRQGMSDEVKWKDEHAGKFAKELADHLEAERIKGSFDRLILAAGPKFLGLLRDELENGTESAVVHQFDKNWTHEDVKKIRKHLPEYL